MKFHLQAPTDECGDRVRSGVGARGATEYRHNLVLLPDAVVEGWAPAGFSALTEARLRVAAHVLNRNWCCSAPVSASSFPHPRLLQALSAARVGVEAMDTRAACRTFNILVAEGRRVAAALVLA